MSRAAYHHQAPLFFLAYSVVAQALAISTAVILRSHTESLALVILGYTSAILLTSRAFSMPRSWMLMNALLGPCTLFILLGELPTTLPALLIAVTLLLYAPTFWTRVPYYPTSSPTYQAVETILRESTTDRQQLKRSFSFLDVGSGFGGLLNFLSRRFPEANFEGVEISPLAFAASWLRFCLRSNVRIRFRSLWSCTLRHYDVVYAFLSPGPMPQLYEKARQEMQPSSVMIVNSFPLPTPATQEIEVPDRRGSTLYIYVNRDSP